jgi:hypothetical protein
MHSRPSVTATRFEFKKVRPLPLQIAEENQSICASCLLRGRNVFRHPIVPLLQDEPFGLTPFILGLEFGRTAVMRLQRQERVLPTTHVALCVVVSDTNFTNISKQQRAVIISVGQFSPLVSRPLAPTL